MKREDSTYLMIPEGYTVKGYAKDGTSFIEKINDNTEMIQFSLRLGVGIIAIIGVAIIMSSSLSSETKNTLCTLISEMSSVCVGDDVKLIKNVVGITNAAIDAAN